MGTKETRTGLSGPFRVPSGKTRDLCLLFVFAVLGVKWRRVE